MSLNLSSRVGGPLIYSEVALAAFPNLGIAVPYQRSPKTSLLRLGIFLQVLSLTHGQLAMRGKLKSPRVMAIVGTQEVLGLVGDDTNCHSG